ncbi:uncharacterized protein LOC143568233 [Bidens hawaiensis]|uniref:uncharacterized protein LOC143568233 n=1 Tax=Bidens hawaiensis TaxID=980011 RepID=UPI00404B5E6A
MRSTNNTRLVPLGLIFFLVLFDGSLAQQLSCKPKQSPRLSGRSDCQFQKITAREPNRQLVSEAGFSEFWDAGDKDELECAGVEVVRHTINPKGLLLPYYPNTPELVYVVRGQGIQGTVLPGCEETFQTSFTAEGGAERFTDKHQKVYRYKEGDVLALPAGAVHWTYNDGDKPTVVVALRDTSNVANQLDRNFKKFFLAGNPQSQMQQGEPQPGQPGSQPGHTGWPQPQPGWQPGQPGTSPGLPGSPRPIPGQPGFPGWPQLQPGWHPGQPGLPRPIPGQPGVPGWQPGSSPGLPESSKPGFPGSQPGLPGSSPSFPGSPKPGQPGWQPGFPGSSPGLPESSKPGFPGSQPGLPGSSTSFPGSPKPGQPGWQPGFPGSSHGLPESPKPGFPGSSPGLPGSPKPGQPGSPKPGQPGSQPGHPGWPKPQPGWQPGQPGTSPGLPGSPRPIPGQPGFPGWPQPQPGCQDRRGPYLANQVSQDGNPASQDHHLAQNLANQDCQNPANQDHNQATQDGHNLNQDGSPDSRERHPGLPGLPHPQPGWHPGQPGSPWPIPANQVSQDGNPASQDHHLACQDCLNPASRDHNPACQDRHPTNPGLPGSSPSQPGSPKPGQPGSPKPGLPGSSKPSLPGSQPGQPGSSPDQPGLPGSSPSQPGSSKPGQPGSSKPGQPGSSKPGQPGSSKPGQPGSSKPSQPGSPIPSLPGWQPGLPGSSKPGQPGSPKPRLPGSQPCWSPDRPGSQPDHPGSQPTPQPGQPGSQQSPHPGQPGSQPSPQPGSSRPQPGQPKWVTCYPSKVYEDPCAICRQIHGGNDESCGNCNKVHTQQEVEGFNMFAGFDDEILHEIFDSEYDIVRQLKGLFDDRGLIVLAENFHVLVPEEQEQFSPNVDNDIEQTICSTQLSANIGKPAFADVYNPRGGRISSLNSHKLPVLESFQLSAEKGLLYKNAVLAPHYNLNAHSIIYITSGSSHLQIVGNDGTRVFDDVVKEGQLIVVPQDFAVIKKAGEEGCEWVAFKTNDNAITTQLAGRFSYIRSLPEDVLVNSYNISRQEAKSLKYNRMEGVVLSPHSASPIKKAKNVLLNALFG